MQSIRIVSVPPGRAPEEIRKCWVGATIPLATAEHLAQNPLSGFKIGNDNDGGHLVLREKAIAALIEISQHEAAAFWESLPLGMYLQFKKEACELV